MSPSCCGGRSPPPPRRRALLRHTDVPPRVTESYILSGYRYPDYSLAECLWSAFRPTNETGNFWTHFLPVFVFAYHFAAAFTWEGAPAAGDPFFYPLWSYLVGVLMLLLASSTAHLLNSMSLVVREVCFFVDYGTISAYTVGSSLAYYYYIHPRAGIRAAEATNATAAAVGSKPDEGGLLRGDAEEPPLLLHESPWPDFSAFFDDFYIPSSCLVAIICVLSCCNTRQRWRKHRYVIRTLVFLLPFLVSSTPVFYRLLAASPYPAASTAFASSASMAGFFYRHCFWLVVSAAFNISKVPERLAPGRFDLWGHSHQWFHCCTFLSILDELHMIQSEVRALLLSPGLLLLPSSSSPPPPRLPGPTLASTLGVMLLLQTAIACIIAWFSCCAHRIYAPQQRHLLLAANEERSSTSSGNNHLKCH